MTTPRKLALATGAFFLLTHVTSVPAGLLFTSVLEEPTVLLGRVSLTPLLWGAWFEVLCALGIVGTAVALFPVVRHSSEALAMGYVGLRTLEAAVIAGGVVPLLTATSLVPSLQGVTSSEPSGLGPLVTSLVGLHEWTRLVGPGLICGINTLVMAYLLLKSRLVPRFIPILGLLGGPLVFAHSSAQLLGVPDAVLSWTTLAVVPIFAWELSLAIWLIARGFTRGAEASRGAGVLGTVPI